MFSAPHVREVQCFVSPLLCVCFINNGPVRAPIHVRNNVDGVRLLQFIFYRTMLRLKGNIQVHKQWNEYNWSIRGSGNINNPTLLLRSNVSCKSHLGNPLSHSCLWCAV